MKKIHYLLITCLVIGCKATTVNPTDVIHDIKVSGSNYVADGTTIIDVWTYLDKDADADKRSVIFSSTTGTFISSNDTTATVTAAFENGQLVARTKFKMPFVPGPLFLKARPATVNRFAKYKIADTLQIAASVPATLKLLPSSLGLKTGYTGEITLTATLKNANGNNVSSGTKVLFESIPASGVFRTIRDTTDVTSTTVSSFTAGSTSAPTTLLIRCTYLNKGSSKTAIKDSCTINISN
jgi:hypothetical protein